MPLRQLDICYEYVPLDLSTYYQWWEVYYWDDSITPIDDANISTVLYYPISTKPWRYIAVKGWQVHDAPGSSTIIATGGPTTQEPDAASSTDWFLLDYQAYAVLRSNGRKVGAKWLRGYGHDFYAVGDEWTSAIYVTLAGWLTTMYESGPLRSRGGDVIDLVTINRGIHLRVRRHGTERAQRIYIP